VVALLAYMSLAASGAHAAGWVKLAGAPALELADAQTAPSLAVDGQGDLWVAFLDGPLGSQNLHVFERPPGGTLTSVLELPVELGHTASVAVNAAGTVAVSWTTFNTPEDATVHVVTKPAGGSFGTPQQLGDSNATDPREVVLPDGTVLVAWNEASGGTASAVDLASGAAGSALTDDPIAGQGTEPTLAGLVSDAAGDADLFWEQGNATGRVSINYVRRSAGGQLSTVAVVRDRPLGVTEAEQRFGPVVATMDPAGDAAVTWEIDLLSGSATSETASAALQLSVQPAGANGQFPTRQTLATTASTGPPGSVLLAPAGSWNSYTAAPVFDPQRNLDVLWGDGSSTSACEIEQAVGPAVGGYALGSHTPVASGDAVAATALAAGGVAALATSDYKVAGTPNLACPSAQALTPLSIAAGGSPVLAAPLSPGTIVNPGSVAADAAGDAYVAWCESAPGACSFPTKPFGLAAYDAAPPTVGAISVPGNATARASAPLSVNPVDAAAGVASVSWTFGDGHSGSGASVTHTWTSPGKYTVSVTATDATGNVSPAAHATVVVTAAGGGAKPKLSDVSESHRRWADADKPATIASKKSPVGTKFSFRLNTEANIKLTFTQKHTCTPGKHKRKCSKTVTAGTLAFANTAAGAHTVSFAGRLSKHKKLHAGNYAATLTATNSAGHASSKQLKFTILGQLGRH
jgi:hypothetical protein